jgi:hypothetical protein
MVHAPFRSLQPKSDVSDFGQLEQISLGSNREDSQRVINERVWWH